MATAYVGQTPLRLAGVPAEVYVSKGVIAAAESLLLLLAEIERSDASGWTMDVKMHPPPPVDIGVRRRPVTGYTLRVRVLKHKCKHKHDIENA